MTRRTVVDVDALWLPNTRRLIDAVSRYYCRSSASRKLQEPSAFGPTSTEEITKHEKHSRERNISISKF